MSTTLAAIVAVSAVLASAGHTCAGPVACALPTDVQGDMVIAKRTVWRGGHYRIHGNLILDRGGVLVLERSTVELMNTYSRQFRYLWRGGRLISSASTLGGTMRDGVICQSNIELLDGSWDARDTTVRYVYGIVFGSERTGRLRATNLIAGPNPDSVIMGGRGDVELRDSTFAISLTCDASRGGSGVFDLPTEAPVSAVYDQRNVPGAAYRLRLVNCRVPMWFLFVGGISTDGTRAEIGLRGSGPLIPSITAHNLRGSVNLPTNIERPVTIGNVTWKPLSGPVRAPGWGVYLSGDRTDVTLTGPTRIAELMLWAGKAALIGDEGSYNAATNATTIDVGSDAPPSSAELRIRNATIGWFGGKAAAIRGQITASAGSHIVIDHARCDALTLITRGQGTIAMRDILREGEFKRMQSGGPITVQEAPSR